MGCISRFWLVAFIVCVVCAGGCVLTSTSAGSNCRQSPGSLEVAVAIAADKDVARSLRALPYMAGPMLKEELDRIQAYGDLAIPALVGGLSEKEPNVRSASAYLLGEIGDPSALPELRKLDADLVPAVRYEAATARISLGDWTTVPALIAGLRDEDRLLRYKCFTVLSKATGLSFGYDYVAPSEKRESAADQWWEWWNSVAVQQLAQAHSP